MYNFLDPRLMPKVSCASPVMDSYEAENLINPKETIRRRGFLCYSVIKPPIDLEFIFLCPINISHIVLDTSLGSQKSSGIEILAKTPSSNYISICKTISEDNPHIVFCNSTRFSKNNPPENDHTKKILFFKCNTGGIFTNATSIKLIIFKTIKSVPCLGSIKVIGTPAKTCSDVTVATIKRLLGLVPRPVPADKSTNRIEADKKLPDDFIDELTFEVMALPMTLPSGKTIDQDTLEKHIENERSFGRKPCDPFTGLKFTETRKPVLNVALKSRIDMFLLHNMDNSLTFSVKRTLGRDVDKISGKRFKKSDLEVKCGICGLKDTLYLIPCQHFYCRACLLNLNSYYCNVCQTEFTKTDPQRYFI